MSQIFWIAFLIIAPGCGDQTSIDGQLSQSKGLHSSQASSRSSDIQFVSAKADDDQIDQQIEALRAQLDLLQSQTGSTSKELSAKINALAQAVNRLEQGYEKIQRSGTPKDSQELQTQILALLLQMNTLLLEMRTDSKMPTPAPPPPRKPTPVPEKGCFILTDFNCKTDFNVKNVSFLSWDYKYFEKKGGVYTEKSEHLWASSSLLEKKYSIELFCQKFSFFIRRMSSNVCPEQKVKITLTGVEILEKGENVGAKIPEPQTKSCPNDQDCDGVSDKEDQCPNTRPGEHVWKPGHKGYKKGWAGCAGGQEPSRGGIYIE